MSAAAASDAWVEQARAVPIEDELSRRGIHLRGKIERAGPCPVCGGTDRFSINTQKQLWNCRGCGKGGDVIDLVQHIDGIDFTDACTKLAGDRPQAKPNGNGQAGPPAKEITVERWLYHDENGAVLFAVKRIEYQLPDGSFVLKDGKHKKTFKQGRPDPNNPGKWLLNVDSVRVVPYRLPELLKALDDGQIVFIVEDERKADLLWSWKLPATSCAMGAGKWKPEHAAFFNGADVVILPDNDEPGRKHADVVAASLQDIAHAVRILDLPNLGTKEDILDWAKAGGTVEQLHNLIEREAKPWAGHSEAKADPEPEAGASANAKKSERSKGNGCVISEHTVALAFTEEHRGNLRFDHDIGKWFCWNGQAWRGERTALAFDWARAIGARLIESEDDKTRRAAGRSSFAAGVEKFARADRVFAVTAEMWDRDIYLLGTSDGVVDLRTGKLRPATREDYITKQTAVVPAASADCPNWLQFLHEATKGDDALIGFLQRFAGYALTGDTKEHMLLFIYGDGGNGKGVFQRSIGDILGDYCTIATMDTFTASKWDRHSTELAMLRGARLVMASETEEGRAWAESRIKQMTGGDPISARFMRQDNFTFMPQFKLLLIGNHKPSLRNVDDAARRRFNIVPFVHKPAYVDKDLEEKKLKPEWPAILRWMIDGCLEWRRIGLAPPPIVIDTTKEYFAEQDLVRQWIEEKCETMPTSSDTHANLYKSWFTWAEESGERPGTAKWFSQAVDRLGFRKFRTAGTRGFSGIKLKQAYADDR